MKLLKPIISESVYKILRNLVKRKKTIEAKPLNDELVNAEVVKDHFLDSKTVSLNSIVEFVSSSFKKPMRFQIVLPEYADLAKKKISVLSPIAAALIGFKEQDHFNYLMPSGVKNIKILKVYNTQ